MTSHRLAFIVVGLLLLTAAPLARSAQVQAWLLLNQTGDDAVLTLAAHEKDVLTGAGWQIDGTGVVSDESIPGAALLHRMIRNGAEGVERMLESDADQVAKLKQDGFTEEGLLGYVAAEDGPERIPVVQFTKGSKRLWLVDERSQKTAEANQWTRQGVQFWLWALPPAAAAK